jgi:histidinol-phosphate aminotransferase
MKYMKKSFTGMVPYHSKLITDGIILNANESPILPPQKVLDEIKTKITNIEFNRYPDMDEIELNKAIAKRYNVKPENISSGVGSDELLDVIFRATLEPNDIVLGFSPSFSMYKVFAELVGAKYIPVLGDENGIFNVSDMIKAIKEYNPKLVLICTPNNPTGQYFSEDEVRKIIESTDALIALDLAYIDFAKKDYYYLGIEYDNVIAFKTFSKAMALPSIRVGYAISNKDNIDMIDAIKAPYSVSTISQIIATTAINNFDLYKGQIKMIVKEREKLYKDLKALGFKVYPSEANFLYVLFDDKYNDELLKNKIYIRKFKSGVYRITVGSQYENERLMEVLKNETKSN